MIAYDSEYNSTVDMDSGFIAFIIVHTGTFMYVYVCVANHQSSLNDFQTILAVWTVNMYSYKYRVRYVPVPSTINIFNKVNVCLSVAI